jgi:hypothetical protein
MKTRPLLALCLFAASYAPAAVLYVDSNNTGPAAPCLAWALLTSNIVWQADTTTYTDTNATGAGPFFYRVGVGN